MVHLKLASNPDPTSCKGKGSGDMCSQFLILLTIPLLAFGEGGGGRDGGEGGGSFSHMYPDNRGNANSIGVQYICTYTRPIPLTNGYDPMWSVITLTCAKLGKMTDIKYDL